MQSDGGDSSGSTNGKGSATNNPDDLVCGGGLEQPLDLSAKTSSSSGLDQRNIFK